MMRERKYKLAGGIVLLAFVIVLGVIVQRVGESRRVRAAPILMYHKIGPVTANAWWVPVDVFARQMRALRDQGYRTILPGDIIDHRKFGKKLPRKPVMITFDDGYRDSLIAAEPILKQCGFRAVAYLITDTVAETPETRRQYDGLDVVTWPEVREMQKRGTFVFGGHGNLHQNLAVLPDPYPNIHDCHMQLRRHGIRQPVSFCYPHGQYNAHTIAAVKRAGFKFAVVCEDRVAQTGTGMNLLAMPRVSVMGGEHDFHVNRLSASATSCAIVLHVMHTGIPVEVSPRLVWDDACAFACANAAADKSCDPGWLPAVEVRNGDYEWRWPQPASGSNAVPVRLEIWDKHRLFPMFSGK